MRSIIAASAALCLGLSACVSAGNVGTDGSIPVTISIPASVVAKVRPYCGKLQTGAIGLPIFLGILRASGVSLPASATDSAAIAASIISQVCAVSPAVAQRAIRNRK